MTVSAPVVVTTSWDDGDALDLKLAEMLVRAGVVGTFYVPVECPGRRVMSESELRDLRALGMEIGSHGVHHTDVTRLAPDALRRELSESKERLEQVVQEPIRSFCYPLGKFSPAAARAAEACGYAVARTTVAFRTGLHFDPYRMPVTLQMFPHRRDVHVRHALAERNGGGLTAWLTQFGARADLASLTARAFDRVRAHGGVLHLWGHSWELEAQGLWARTQSIIEAVAGHDDVRYLSNTGVADAVSARGTR